MTDPADHTTRLREIEARLGMVEGPTAYLPIDALSRHAMIADLRYLLDRVRAQSERNEALEAERDVLRAQMTVPEHLRGDGPCSNCGTLDNIVWFTENVLWNAVTGEEVTGTDAHYDILCIPCFIIRADAAGLHPTGWRLMAEWPWRERTLPAPETVETQG